MPGIVFVSMYVVNFEFTFVIVSTINAITAIMSAIFLVRVTAILVIVIHCLALAVFHFPVRRDEINRLPVLPLSSLLHSSSSKLSPSSSREASSLVDYSPLSCSSKPGATKSVIISVLLLCTLLESLSAGQ